MDLPAKVIGQSATARVRIRVALNGELIRRTVTARALRVAEVSEYPDWDQQWKESHGQSAETSQSDRM